MRCGARHGSRALSSREHHDVRLAREPPSFEFACELGYDVETTGGGGGIERPCERSFDRIRWAIRWAILACADGYRGFSIASSEITAGDACRSAAKAGGAEFSSPGWPTRSAT